MAMDMTVSMSAVMTRIVQSDAKSIVDIARPRPGEASLSQILADPPGSIGARTVQGDLSMLRGFGLVDSSGRGRGARWRPRR